MREVGRWERQKRPCQHHNHVVQIDRRRCVGTGCTPYMVCWWNSISPTSLPPTAHNAGQARPILHPASKNRSTHPPPRSPVGRHESILFPCKDSAPIHTNNSSHFTPTPGCSNNPAPLCLPTQTALRRSTCIGHAALHIINHVCRPHLSCGPPFVAFFATHLLHIGSQSSRATPCIILLSAYCL